MQEMQETWVWSLGWEDTLEYRKWQPAPVFLPGEFHGQRSLAGYNLWDHKESDTTEQPTIWLSQKLKVLDFAYWLNCCCFVLLPLCLSFLSSLIQLILWLKTWFSSKESACQCRRCGFNPWVRKIPWRRKWQPTPIFLPEEFHGQRSLTWGHIEWDMTEQPTLTALYRKLI